MFSPLQLSAAFEAVASACSLSVGLPYLNVNQASILQHTAAQLLQPPM